MKEGNIQREREVIKENKESKELENNPVVIKLKDKLNMIEQTCI